MALSFAPATKVITIPQADLTPVTGTLYSLDTNAFRLEVIDYLDSDEGMVLDDAIRHNTEVVVSGTTYARTIEIINGWSVAFEDGAYSVRLEGSNNNIFDIQSGVLTQNQVQVIPTNSAGLITVVSGSGVTTQDKIDIKNLIFDELVEGTETFRETLRLIRAEAVGLLVRLSATRWLFKSRDGLTNRIDATVTEQGERTTIVTDPD